NWEVGVQGKALNPDLPKNIKRPCHSERSEESLNSLPDSSDFKPFCCGLVFPAELLFLFSVF
ncbi:MAG: hypothetical protein AB7S72_12865, partial [Draconibacterium sp.]